MINSTRLRNCVGFLLLCELTQSPILWSQKLGSTKWRAVLRKTCIFEAYVWIIYNNRFQTLFIDQLDRSKAVCHFNVRLMGTIDGSRLG